MMATCKSAICMIFTGKNNRFPFLAILGYLKNTHKNPKFGKVRQFPIRELGWEFPGWDSSHFAKFGIFPKISKNGNLLFFSCVYDFCEVWITSICKISHDWDEVSFRVNKNDVIWRGKGLMVCSTSGPA